MKAVIRRALLLDAFYQVLDNKVFRFLIFAIGVVVLLSCVVGFRQEQVEIFFGRWSVRYDQFGAAVGQGVTGGEIRIAMIQFLQERIVDGLAGIVGMILCISATSFFVPRMLERGSADIAFSKPLSRLRLLLARYMAGVLFVALLSVLLIGGIYAGLLVGSGYNDPGFLWSALTLIYLFSILHAVSTLIGVMTRSTVASILVTIMFFWFNGCIQQTWIGYEYGTQKDVASALRTVEEVPEGLFPAEDEEAAADEEPDEESSAFIEAMVRTLKAMHYVGPKTTDAGFLSNKLLKTLNADELVDATGKLTVVDLPDGLARSSPSSRKVDLETTPAVWEGREELAGLRIELSREARLLPENQGRRLSALRAARTYRDELDPARIRGEVEEERLAIDRMSATFFAWTEDGPEGAVAREAALFAFGDWMFLLEASCPEDLAEPASAAVRALAQEIRFARDELELGPNEWYERKLGLTSELKFNVFFSIGSSVAFAMVMLALAWWRLSRIDF